MHAYGARLTMHALCSAQLQAHKPEHLQGESKHSTSFTSAAICFNHAISWQHTRPANVRGLFITVQLENYDSAEMHVLAVKHMAADQAASRGYLHGWRRVISVVVR